MARLVEEELIPVKEYEQTWLYLSWSRSSITPLRGIVQSSAIAFGQKVRNEATQAASNHWAVSLLLRELREPDRWSREAEAFRDLGHLHAIWGFCGLLGTRTSRVSSLLVLAEQASMQRSWTRSNLIMILIGWRQIKLHVAGGGPYPLLVTRVRLLVLDAGLLQRSGGGRTRAECCASMSPTRKLLSWSMSMHRADLASAALATSSFASFLRQRCVWSTQRQNSLEMVEIVVRR